MSLKHLAEALTEGATVVTVNDRLARRLRELVAEKHRGAGDTAWETPPVLPFGAWLNRLYAARRDAFFTGAPTCKVQLLTPAQSEAVWARLIRDSAAGGDLLQPWAAAETAAEAWRLCQAWRVPLARLGSGGDDSAAFVAWARAFDARCAREGWLDAARLPDWLRDELAHLELPQRLIFAGFDEWTPQQAVLLN
ncbi:MAG TPA: PD-(D/E)XK nuclease family protein, partial [Gammaproteobacteria bacterium]|nr:PD-(D/E)XK nuclease family protein [Gammaproteobacteria bacterium]